MSIGIKTSLHEVRHAIMNELLGRKTLEIAVVERYNGYTRFAPMKNPSEIKTFFVLIAPYIKRIKEYDWNRFLMEYGCLTDIGLASKSIKRAKDINIFDTVINEIDRIFDLNKELIDSIVQYLDRNGKGHPEKVSREQLDEFIRLHPLQGKQDIQNLYQQVKSIW